MADPGGMESIGNILAGLMARKGFARVQGAAALDAAWKQAAGELIAQHTRVGAVRRKKLEILVANSTLVQELGFQKAALLKALKALAPDEPIDDLRFKVGPIG